MSRFTEVDGLAEYRSAWEAVADALVAVDAQQRIVGYNQAAADMFQFPAAEVMGRPMQLLVPARFHRAHAARVDDFAAGPGGHVSRASSRPQVVGRRRDGTEFPAEISLLIDDGAGHNISVATIRDVSAQSQLERALADSEARFRATFESSPLPMALTDTTMRVMAGNQALADLIGVSPEDMEGEVMTDMVAVDDRPALRGAIGPLVAGETTRASAEVRLRRADGGHAILNMHGALVTDDAGAPDYVITQAIDVTERVEATQRLEEMVRSRDALIASISHEFRTPLTALMGFAHLLRDDQSLTSSEHSEMIESMVRQSADLANLVDDLLVAAKAEIGALEVVRVPVDLRAQASQVLETWQPSDVKPVSLEGSARGTGDPSRVRQIIRNLVSNALRYGGDAVSVVITLDGDDARLAVIDNGRPIPQEDRVRIFEPYERAHQPAGGVTGSMGLGLSISRHLAQLMEGDLTYRHEGGAGVFELTLPAAGTEPGSIQSG